MASKLEKLEQYAQKVDETEYHTTSIAGKLSYDNQLEQTIDDLTKRLAAEQATLDKLKSSSSEMEIDQPSDDPKLCLRQLQAIKGAYDKLTPSDPSSPSHNSALPALLAVRNTQRLVNETKESIPATHEALKLAREDLSKETSDLSDSKVLNEALKSRVSRLQNLLAEKSVQSSDEAARALIDSETSRKAAFDKGSKKLTRALLKFTNDTLAPLLAAEELGGPVVGSLMDITDDMLAVGFNNQGKPKKSKSGVNEDKRQKRIDELWGRQNEMDDSFEENPKSEAEAAAQDMKRLLEELLDAAMEQGSGSYVSIDRESAASRFLVRARVAQLHPKDARKIRLIDFGRELDD